MCQNSRLSICCTSLLSICILYICHGEVSHFFSQLCSEFVFMRETTILSHYANTEWWKYGHISYFRSCVPLSMAPYLKPLAWFLLTLEEIFLGLTQACDVQCYVYTVIISCVFFTRQLEWLFCVFSDWLVLLRGVGKYGLSYNRECTPTLITLHSICFLYVLLTLHDAQHDLKLAVFEYVLFCCPSFDFIQSVCLLPSGLHKLVCNPLMFVFQLPKGPLQQGQRPVGGKLVFGQSSTSNTKSEIMVAPPARTSFHNTILPRRRSKRILDSQNSSNVKVSLHFCGPYVTGFYLLRLPVS